MGKFIIFLFAVLGLGFVGYVVAEIYESSMDINYAPKQPINFSHKIHAGDNKMECTYCHFNVDKSRHATVPPTSVCMGCHQTVAQDRPEIQKLKRIHDADGSVEWIKIHHVPEHVYFPHNKHVAAGVECQTCHGEIETMDVVKQVNEFTMGYCLDCHRDNDYVNAEQNVGILNYRSHHESVIHLGDSGRYSDVLNKNEKMAVHPKTHMNAATSCSTCHQ